MVRNNVFDRIQERSEVMSLMECESCAYYLYDEEYEELYCDIDMDEDDACRLMEHPESHCPYYRNNDEYAVVRHQM